MKAVAVTPRRAGSTRLMEVPEPHLDAVPDGRGVLVEVERVGICGTDRELIAGAIGAAPEGDDYLVIGHENFGRISKVGANVPPSLRPGGYAVTMVRRPGSSIYDRMGMQDMTTDESAPERGINRLHGFMTERYVDDAEFVIPVPEPLRAVGVLLEPLSVSEKGVRQAELIQRRLGVWRPRRGLVLGAGPIGLLAALTMALRGMAVTCYSRERPPFAGAGLIGELGGVYVCSRDVTLDGLVAGRGTFDLALDATGYSPVALEAALTVGKDGVLVLASVTSGDRKAELPTDRINQTLVMGNGVIVGTVNAAHEDFTRGVSDMLLAEAMYPGWLGRLLTTPVEGLAAAAELLGTNERDPSTIKAYVEMNAGGAA